MNKKSRANFIYKIGDLDEKKYLLIVDQDSGGMSVTNDIENVVADISQHEGVDPLELTIIYKDSMGNWNGWDHESQDFYPFRHDIALRLSHHLNIK